MFIFSCLYGSFKFFFSNLEINTSYWIKIIISNTIFWNSLFNKLCVTHDECYYLLPLPCEEYIVLDGIIIDDIICGDIFMFQYEKLNKTIYMKMYYYKCNLNAFLLKIVMKTKVVVIS